MTDCIVADVARLRKTQGFRTLASPDTPVIDHSFLNRIAAGRPILPVPLRVVGDSDASLGSDRLNPGMVSDENVTIYALISVIFPSILAIFHRVLSQCNLIHIHRTPGREGPNVGTAEPPDFVTAAAYLAAEELALTKSEYIDGSVRAMTGATNRHHSVMMNCVLYLGTQLKGKRFRPFGSDTKVHIRQRKPTRFY